MAILNNANNKIGSTRTMVSIRGHEKSNNIPDEVEVKQDDVFEECDKTSNFVKSKKDGDDDKKNDEDNADNTDNTDNAGNADDTDDEPNFRDKDKELKELIKSNLSHESQDVINLNNDEFDKIIESLKKKSLSSEKGIELQKLRNISRGSRNFINNN